VAEVAKTDDLTGGLTLLQSIPGIKEMNAASILAEIGPDMGQFAAPRSRATIARPARTSTDASARPTSF
jgi:transposase